MEYILKYERRGMRKKEKDIVDNKFTSLHNDTSLCLAFGLRTGIEDGTACEG
jgi:hypothetical protein